MGHLFCFSQGDSYAAPRRAPVLRDPTVGRSFPFADTLFLRSCFLGIKDIAHWVGRVSCHVCGPGSSSSITWEKQDAVGSPLSHLVFL